MKAYNPRRDRVDWDLCEQIPDGSVRDAAGRLIYMPMSNCGTGLSGAGREAPSQAHTDHSIHTDEVWDAYLDFRRLTAPEPFFPASLEGIAAWLRTQHGSS